MKYIIAGGRDFNNFEVLKNVCDNFDDITEIVCGCARGADTLGENYGRTKKILIKYFPADWDYYGHAAGFIRNIEMADYADCAICFWDGKSNGTKHMIDTMKRKNKPCYIFNYNGEKGG